MFVLSDAMTDLDIQELANLTAGDADVDNFERLFTKLKEMKGKQGDEKQTHNFVSKNPEEKNYKPLLALFYNLQDFWCVWSSLSLLV